METFDVYHRDRTKAGKVVGRETPAADGEYYLIVHVWIRDNSGEYLLTRRAQHKTFGGLWECPGGGAVAGETSLDTALREIREETGVALDPARGRIIHQCVYDAIHALCDVWHFEQDTDIREAAPQEEDVTGVRKASPAEIQALRERGEFVPVYGYLDWFLGKYQNRYNDGGADLKNRAP